MTIYAYRCESHGDFDVVSPMTTTTRLHPCPTCSVPALKLLSGALQFTMGKDNFHGPTLGERRADTIQANEAQGRKLGRDYESAARWV